MSRFLSLFPAVILLLALSCQSRQHLNSEDPLSNRSYEIITADTPFLDLDELTKTNFSFADARFLWASGDKVGIVSENGSQLCFPIQDEDDGKTSAHFDGRGWALLSSTHYLAYYPFIADYDLNYQAVPVSYAGQEQSGNNSYANLGRYAFWVAQGVSPDEGQLHFSFKDVGSVIRFSVPVVAGQYTSASMILDDELFALQGTVDLSAGDGILANPLMSSQLDLALNECTVANDGENLVGFLMTYPLNASGHPIRVLSTLADGTSVLSVIAGRSFDVGKAAAISAKTSVCPASVQAGNEGGSITVKLIKSAADVVVNVACGNDWLSQTSSTTVGNVTSYVFTVAENPGAEREGTISFTEEATGLVNTVKIVQSKAGSIIGIGGWDVENHSGNAE